MFAWIITHDVLGDEPDAVGVAGPRRIDPDLHNRVGGGEGQEFRLLDDDGEVYYRGRMLIVDEDGTEDEFAPLHDWAGPNAGCTAIQYRQADGSWRQL